MNKNIIENNFSRCAECYDHYASMQRFSAFRLVNNIIYNHFDKILELGCGTGIYTELLMEKYPQARIKAIDISEKMIQKAKEKIRHAKIDFVIADAENIEINEEVDFITSNATFQWFEDLEKTFLRYSNFLAKDGCIQFSIMGPLTYIELGESLNKMLGEQTSISSKNFINESKLKIIMSSIFREVHIERYFFNDHYSSLKALLEKIKYTGEKGFGMTPKKVWTKDFIDKLEKVYIEKYGDIIASYEIYFCKGKK